MRLWYIVKMFLTGANCSVFVDASHNLVELEVKNAWLSVENLSPMPMLTTLTLESVRLDENHLS